MNNSHTYIYSNTTREVKPLKLSKFEDIKGYCRHIKVLLMV